jgi:hypothetical protein
LPSAGLASAAFFLSSSMAVWGAKQLEQRGSELVQQFRQNTARAWRWSCRRPREALQSRLGEARLQEETG